ncbi:unnamed protein product [Closterium sp. NIES-53]
MHPASCTNAYTAPLFAPSSPLSSPLSPFPPPLSPLSSPTPCQLTIPLPLSLGVLCCVNGGEQEACEPVMTAYKMVTVDAPYWGFGKRLELFVLAPHACFCSLLPLFSVLSFPLLSSPLLPSPLPFPLLGGQGERALFLEGHRKCYGWMDEWCELTMDDVRRIEKDNIEAMRKNLALNNKVAPDEYNEDESKDEVDDSQDYADCSGADLADSPKG